MNVEQETSSSEEQQTTTEEETTATIDTTEGASEEETQRSLVNNNEDSSEQDPPTIEPLSAEDISFGEDIEVSEELQSELLEAFNNQELDPKARAQALVDLHVKAMKAAGEASVKQWSDMQQQWQDEVKADAEIGGENLQPALERISRLLKERGSPELLGVMDLTGAGNNPHVLKFLDSVAKDLTEGGPVSGGPKGDERSAASKLYPSMKG